MKIPLRLVVVMALAPITSLSAADTPATVRAPAPKLGSTVFNWDQLEVKSSGVGERRDVARNPTATMAELECHISTLNPGLPSHPPHIHPQEELIIIKEGSLDVHINGVNQRVGPGSLFFFAAYDSHAVRNVGREPATYYVFNFSTAATKSLPKVAAAESAGSDKLRSAVYEWSDLPAKPTAKGARRDVFDSPTVTCENLECHVTTLRAGESPHASHRHPDEEIIIVKEGTLEATINGTAHRGGVGTIFFFGSNDEHGLKNIGTTDATYYVMRIVTDATPKAASL
ncbi:MAG TPA: cupin domain-containing protein [Opitutus sp.]|nr:cupin domain-containing protein [Opitutus sp.]